jgi:hypothetical protein
MGAFLFIQEKIMAREFKELAPLRTDSKKFNDGMDRIKHFAELRKKIEDLERKPACDQWRAAVKEILGEVARDLGTASAFKMVEVLELPFCLRL